MKIRALRLREAGPFRQPIALEGLTGGFDVLAGPNELGKSTLFRALNVLFTVKHTTNTSRSGDDIVRLRTDGASAPLIEADFEVEGKLWRLRKQFYARPEAVLTDLAEQRVVRGGEAEAQIEGLLVGPAGMGQVLSTWRDLLWVQQLNAVSLATAEVHKASLQDLIGEEIGAVAEGPRLRGVRQQTETALRQLVGRQGRPVKGGPLAEAIADRERLRQDIGERRSSAERSRALRERLEVLREQHKEATSPQATDGRLAARDVARNAFAASEKARAQLAAAKHAQDAATSGYRMAADALSRFSVLCSEYERLTAAIVEVERDLAQKKGDGCAAAERLRAATEARDSARRELSEARQRLDRFETQQRRKVAEDRIARVEQLVREARSAAEDLAAAKAQLSQMAATESGVTTAEALSREITVLETELRAARPQVRFAYRPGTSGAFRVSGREVVDGETISATGRLEIDVDGIGRITIEAGSSAAIADLEADLVAQRQSLGDLLANMRCPDIAAARSALEERRRLEGEVTRLKSRLATLTPRGQQALVAELGELRSALEQRRDIDELIEGPRERLDAEVTRLGQIESDAEMRLATAQQEHAELQSEYRELRSRIAAMREQLDKVDGDLPVERTREAEKDRLAEAVVVAERELAIRRRGLEELAATVGDEAVHERLARDLETAERAVREADRQVQLLAVEISRLEGELAANLQAGNASDLKEAEALLADAERRVSRLNDDVSALSLLQEVLTAMERESRDRYLVPVSARITPYLQLLFEGAQIALSDKLAVDSLVRNGAGEVIDRLSTGTQEQIHVLVRLGFARLLADRGAPMPVVLDDALVYSDDHRIGRMFEALAEASKCHQIIMLTCRSEVASRHGGHKLQLQPWSPN